MHTRLSLIVLLNAFLFFILLNAQLNQTCEKNEYWDDCGRCDINCYLIEANKSYNFFAKNFKSSNFTNSNITQDIYYSTRLYDENYKYQGQCKNTQGRCRCKEGYVRQDGKCAKENICNDLNITTPICDNSQYSEYIIQTEIFKFYSKTEGTCANPDPVITEYCGEPKCECKGPMYVRDKYGNCVHRSNCATKYYFPNCKDIKCKANTKCYTGISNACFQYGCFDHVFCSNESWSSYALISNSIKGYLDCNMVYCPEGYECNTKNATIASRFSEIDSSKIPYPICIKKN